MTGEGPWERQAPPRRHGLGQMRRAGVEHEANSGWHLNDVPVALWGWGVRAQAAPNIRARRFFSFTTVCF